METWSAQSGKHGKSTVDQGENIPFLGFGSPPLLGFMLAPLMLCHPSRPRDDPCPHSQADVWAGISFIGRVAAIFGSDSCFALECSPQAEISHQCRRRVADQLSGGETVAGTGRPRQKGPERQSRATRRSSMVEKGIIPVRWERS